MPPAYVAFFIWCSFAILWWTGWRKETANGIPDAAAAVFLAGWPVMAWRVIPLPGAGEVQGAFLWTLLAMLGLFWRMEPTRRAMAASAGFLASSLGVWLTYAVLMETAPGWATGKMAAAAAGVCAALLLRGADGQIAAVSLAVLAPELLHGLWNAEGGPVRIGSAEMSESWWIGVLAARACAAAGRAVRAGWGSLVRKKGG